MSPFFFFFFFFLNPTIEVVTLCLRTLCMLAVFLLPAFIRLGHDCQDFFSPCDERTCAQTRPRFILSPERGGVFFCFVFVLGGGGGGEGRGVRTHVNSKGIKSRLPEAQREDRTRESASRRTASQTHYHLSYCGPRPVSFSCRTAVGVASFRYCGFPSSGAYRLSYPGPRPVWFSCRTAVGVASFRYCGLPSSGAYRLSFSGPTHHDQVSLCNRRGGLVVGRTSRIVCWFPNVRPTR